MGQFRQISTFVEVVARGSLSAAARAEGIAPAMIGRRLDALEERLGVKLLQRTTRKLVLTDEGTAFLEDCQRILAELEEAEAAFDAASIRFEQPVHLEATLAEAQAALAPFARGEMGGVAGSGLASAMCLNVSGFLLMSRENG